MRLLESIFSIKNKGNHKVWNIMGLKFKYKNKNILLSNKLDDLNKNFKKLEPKIVNAERLTNNIRKMGNEHIILPNDYFPYFDSRSIKDDYLNLIKGLDGESILNVQKALARVQQIKNTHYEYFYLTNQEMAEFADYRANFQKAIVQLDENTWAYKDYLLPVSFFDMSVFYSKHHLDKFKTIDYSKSVIDAGASIGDSAVFLSRLFKGNIYSFEPTSELYPILNKTVEINNLHNVFPQKLGLFNEECDKNIYFAGLCGQSTSINEYRDDGQNSEKVHFTTIDKFVKDNDIQVGLIKADVEGSERYLLEGAYETIKEQRPALNISIYHSAEDFFKIKTMIESWNLGYKFKITKPLVSNIIVETSLLAEVEK